MIKYEINVKEKKIHFECEGDVPHLAVDAMTCLKRTYEAIRAVSKEEAKNFIAYAITTLLDPNSPFYEKVNWEDEEWEEPQC